MGLKSNVAAFFLFQFLFFFLQFYIFYPCYNIYYSDKRAINFIDIAAHNQIKNNGFKHFDSKHDKQLSRNNGDLKVNSPDKSDKHVADNAKEATDEVQKNHDDDDLEGGFKNIADNSVENIADNAKEEIDEEEKELDDKNDANSDSEEDKLKKANKKESVPKVESPEASKEHGNGDSKNGNRTSKEVIGTSVHYEANWASLEQRPVPAWFDDAKIGVFIHWGVFSVPSFVGVGTKGYAEWFWLYWMDPLKHQGPPVKSIQEYMKNTHAKNFQYTSFASKFKAEFFDPDHWADVVQSSGARYVVLTSKHHEGYTLWKSKQSSNWNSVDVGPRRDLVDDLRASIKKKTSVKFGLYYSLYEWFNPLFNSDKKNNFTTQDYVAHKVTPDLHSLVNQYQPEVVWANGDGRAPSNYWNSTSFIAWLYNHSPVKDTVVTNDRWGTDATCKHGGYLTCTDRYTPKLGEKVHQKWENCMTIDRESWGYRRNARYADHYDMPGLIELLARTVSGGGNLLVNIGPTADGRIPPIQEERLRQLGLWLKVNGEAIYGTKSCSQQHYVKDNSTFFTCKGDQVYAIITKWPTGDRLTLKSLKPQGKVSVTLLGGRQQVAAEVRDGVTVSLPQFTPSTLPCQWAWVLKFTGVIT